MYKALFFLHKTNEENFEEHFKQFTLKYIGEVIGEKIIAGKVESNLLLEQKYNLFCEVSAETKDEWDKLMNSPAGKKLNEDLSDFHQFITVIFINYNENL